MIYVPQPCRGVKPWQGSTRRKCRQNIRLVRRCSPLTGLKIFFYANEHEPVHVHGRYQDQESKAELIIVEEEVREIHISDVPGKRPLEGDKLRDFTRLVHHKAEDIRLRWIDFL